MQGVRVPLVHSDASYWRGRDKVITCIARSLDINVEHVPVLHVKPFRYFEIIYDNNKRKYLPLQSDFKFIRKRSLLDWEITPGLWKRHEKKVYIKEAHKLDFGILLAELLHSKSVIQEDESANDWINEGLPHYLAKLLSEKCGIRYEEGGHGIYFPFWERIYREKGFDFLRNILFAPYIELAKTLLKKFLEHEDGNIFELSWEEVQNILRDVRNDGER